MDFSLEAYQTQKQQQKLILSAQMRESLQILQMPLLELKERTDEAILENPVLEYESAESDDLSDKIFSIVKNFCEYSSTRHQTGNGTNDCDPFYGISVKPNFYDHLLSQLSEIEISPAMSKVCRYIIWNIDEKGYLSCSAEKIARDLKIDISYAKDGVQIVQQMDPAGVCASNLSDCLAIQLKRQNTSDPVVFKIVYNCLGLLSENKINGIAQTMHISVRQAQSYCNMIKNLNPIPSSGYNTDTDDIFTIPEAVIFKDSSGNFKVACNDTYIPKLFINKFYLKLSQETDDKKTGEYLKDKIKKASSLILEISNRKKTIVRVLEKIVELQPSYFESGINSLKPMSMKDIAKQLGINESTVCRAIRGKYILCPNGIISIKSLFTSAIGDVNFSTASVKSKIKKIFDGENRLQPLSDQSVASILNETEGIKISRRTIAKYRQVLGIPSASKRRNYSDAI